MDVTTILLGAGAVLGSAVATGLAVRSKARSTPQAPACEPIAAVAEEVRELRAEVDLLAARVTHLEARTPRA